MCPHKSGCTDEIYSVCNAVFVLHCWVCQKQSGRLSNREALRETCVQVDGGRDGD